MDTDPELLKLLVETFTLELEEQTQIMIEGLLALEKLKQEDPKYKEKIDSIFRAAHNIKGAARGIGINDVGDISHKLENIFTSIQKKEMTIESSLIDLTLEAVDKLRLAMQAYLTKKPLDFNLPALLEKLELNVTAKSVTPAVFSRNTVEPTAPIMEDEHREKESTRNTNTIRVSIDNIDHVSALLEEIQVNKISIVDHYESLVALAEKIQELKDYWKHNKTSPTEAGTEPGIEKTTKFFHHVEDEITAINQLGIHLHQHFQTQVNELSILANSLQDEVGRLRLIPASYLLQTFPRLVRNLAQELGKEVRLVLKGDEVRMDKFILEGLHDPILHLVRNAIDHGIGTPEIRRQNGKDITGTITIEIIDESNQILIIFKDDGMGINIDKIAEKALEKNLFSSDEIAAMTENEIMQLIFRPGFSTSEIITDVSGRGIGLDVVKSNLAALKGTVQVETVIKKGTTFYLRVPLTLSSERGLLVKSGGNQFMIPTNFILRVENLPAAAVTSVEGQDIIMIDNHPVVLQTLADILGLQRNEFSQAQSLSIVILKKDWHSLAIIVDEICGEREIVVKPLQSPLDALDCVAGGTLSSLGQIILVLNIADLIQIGLHNQFGPLGIIKDRASADKAPLHILVVDDSITTRTLEKNILESHGYQVTVAVNGKEAWDLLQKNTYSMLITDVNMPVMDGFELTARVKQSEKLRTLPVIIVTSLNSDNEKKRGIEVGADAYIVKSEFESSKLLQTIVQLEIL